MQVASKMATLPTARLGFRSELAGVADAKNVSALLGDLFGCERFTHGQRPATQLHLAADSRQIRSHKPHAAGRQAEYRRIEGRGDHGVSTPEPDVHSDGGWDPNRSR